MTSPCDSTDSEVRNQNTQASAQLPGAAPRAAKPPSGLQKAPNQIKQQSKPAKPTNAAEARSKSVYHAMERLLEQGTFSDADLLQAVTNLSGDEFLQVKAASLFSIVHKPVCKAERVDCLLAAWHSIPGVTSIQVCSASIVVPSGCRGKSISRDVWQPPLFQWAFEAEACSPLQGARPSGVQYGR